MCGEHKWGSLKLSTPSPSLPGREDVALSVEPLHLGICPPHHSRLGPGLRAAEAASHGRSWGLGVVEAFHLADAVTQAALPRERSQSSPIPDSLSGKPWPLSDTWMLAAYDSAGGMAAKREQE